VSHRRDVDEGKNSTFFVKKEILARQQHLLAKGVQFYFPVDPKDA